MIRIPRSLARQFQAVLRKSVLNQRSPRCFVVLHGDGNCVRLQCQSPTVAVEYYHADRQAVATLSFPADALADCAGRDDGLVQFEATDSGGTLASWHDGVVPQIRQYEGKNLAELPGLPLVPEQMAPLPPSFLEAMRQAAATAATDRIRYAVDCLQLRGHDGKIASTNGRQLLVQAGFPFPWTGNVLVPALPVFGCRELSADQPVTIGKSEDFVTIQIGSWTLHLAIDKDGRFPNVDAIIPRHGDAVARCHLDPQDQVFLARSLSRLPGADDEHSPITVDLNGQVCVRARAADQKQTIELVLDRSQATGQSLRFALNRAFLGRAIALGLSDLCVPGPEKPLLFQNEQRLFVAVPLDKGSSLPACENAFRIHSAQDANTQRRTPMNSEIPNNPDTATTTNGEPRSAATPTTRHGAKTRKVKSTTLASLVKETEILNTTAREFQSRSHTLLMALKRHRKQARIMETSLRALKELHQIGA